MNEILHRKHRLAVPSQTLGVAIIRSGDFSRRSKATAAQPVTAPSALTMPSMTTNGKHDTPIFIMNYAGERTAMSSVTPNHHVPVS